MGLFFLIKLKVDGNLINVDACCSVDLGGFFIEFFIRSFANFYCVIFQISPTKSIISQLLITEIN
jgi:hypothetical protein